MARFVRVMRAMPSVVTIALGIFAAVQSVMSTFYILGFELFFVAVIFRARFGGAVYQGPKETEEEFFERTGDEGLIYSFRTVNEAFFLCLFAGVFTDNITAVMGELSRKSGMFMVFFFVHVMLTNLTLLNILVGVVCTVIQEATDSQKENIELRAVKDLMLKHLDDVDENNNKMIGPAEFKALLEIEEVADFLEYECSITPKEMALLAETMFYDSKNPGRYKELTFTALLQAILSVRAGKPCTAIDILSLQRDVKQTDKNLRKFQEEVNTKFDVLTSLVKSLKSEPQSPSAKSQGSPSAPSRKARSPRPKAKIDPNKAAANRSQNHFVTSGSSWTNGLGQEIKAEDVSYF
jgi:hypothetical protein